MPRTPIRIVTVGGGGGHAVLLDALREIPGISITAICTAFDTGGSTVKLTADYYRRNGLGGWLGDTTKCVAALCPDRALARALLHRFTSGSLAGHSVKNLLAAGLVDAANNNPSIGLAMLQSMCSIAPHQVWPVTWDRATLQVKMGQVVVGGETYIDTAARNPFWDPKLHPIKRVWLSRKVVASPQALAAIVAANLIILAPGDLFTSVLPVLLVDEFADAISQHQAHLVLVLNLMTKIGETDDFCVGDFLHWIEGFALNHQRVVNTIIANNSPIPDEIVNRYRVREHKGAVISPLPLLLPGRQLISGKLWQLDSHQHVVHDPKQLRQLLCQVMPR